MMRHVLRSCAALWWLAIAASCLPDGDVKIGYNDTPEKLSDGWAIATPAAVGFDSEALRGAYRRLFSEHEFVSARSLLVIRHGQLVAEGYCRSLDDRHLIAGLQSATKSVTSLLFGIARDDGLFPDLDMPVCDALGAACEAHEDKRAITLRHLMTMGSGIDFPNEEFALDVAHGGGKSDSVARILGKRMSAEPGTRFLYQDADVHLLGAAVQASTGKSLRGLAERRLFAPLGIRDFRWLAHADGRSYGAYGLYLKPRDFAKLGLLALQRGSFGGRRIVSEAWIDESTKFQVASEGKPHDHGFDYGLYWWVSSERGIFTADGHGGQFAWVHPELDLLLVMTADWDTAYDGGPAIDLDEFGSLADQIADAIVAP